MNQTHQKLQDIFGKIDEIAGFFIEKMVEKDQSLNLTCDDFTLSKDEFSFSLRVKDNWGNWYFHFPLEKLDLTPAVLYKSWNQEKIAREKAAKQLTKEINRLKKTRDVKAYLDILEGAPY